MPVTDVKKLYTTWLHELWPSAEPGLAEELVSPGFVGHWPDRDVHGPQGLVEVIQESLTLISDVATSINVGPIADGDLVAARWTFRGGYRGGLPGVSAAAGTPVTLRGADVLRVADGKFVEYWVSSDVEQMLAQLQAD